MSKVVTVVQGEVLFFSVRDMFYGDLSKDENH